MKVDLGGVWKIMSFFCGKEGLFWDDLMDSDSSFSLRPKSEENLEF